MRSVLTFPKTKTFGFLAWKEFKVVMSTAHPLPSKK
jgi:hypothetical protein